MADYTRKFTDNLQGRFFVDDSCIYCGMCSSIAPQHFFLSEKKDYYIVKNQPKTKIELDLCLEAMDICPVEAIGEHAED